MNDWHRIYLASAGTGKTYRQIQLHGRIDDEYKGMGARWFPIQRIQNGRADAVALVAPNGKVVEFLSYEGRLTPPRGVAGGIHSDVIDGAESSRTPVGHSLKRGFYDPDHWQVDVASPGVLNLDF